MNSAAAAICSRLGKFSLAFREDFMPVTISSVAPHASAAFTTAASFPALALCINQRARTLAAPSSRNTVSTARAVLSVSFSMSIRKLSAPVSTMAARRLRSGCGFSFCPWAAPVFSCAFCREDSTISARRSAALQACRIRSNGS